MAQVFNPLSGNFDTVLDQAEQIKYDNGTSGLTADEVQGAIDEVEGRLDSAETDISNKADRNLGNLTSPTAFNQDLIPDSDATRSVGSLTNKVNNLFFSGRLRTNADSYVGDGTSAASGQAIQLGIVGGSATANLGITGIDNSAGSTGKVILETGDATGGSSGNVEITTGTATSTRGDINLSARQINVSSSVLPSAANTQTVGNTTLPFLSMTSNLFSLRSGGLSYADIFLTTTPTGATAASFVGFQNVSTASTAIFSRSTTSGTANVLVETGNVASGIGTTGAIKVTTGNALGTGDSGNIELLTGTSGGIRGLISLNGRNVNVTAVDDINLTGEVLLSQDATAALGAVTKQQLDAAIGGADVKSAVTVATTSNITLSGEQTIDGILTSSSRVLVKNQTTQSENGIYTSSSGAWARSSDANTASELNNALVTVAQGATQANSGWYQTTELVTLGVDNVVWTQFFGAGTFTADGQGIELVGSTFMLELDGSTLSKSASGLRVAINGITNNEISGSAAIAYSKLNLANSIVNADINSAAAIAYSKLNLANSIVNADINSAAAIDYSKLASLTTSRALESNGSGIVSVSAVTSTELSYLSGVTSSIQNQLNSKFAYNTQSVSVSGSLVAGTTYLANSSGGAITLTLPAPANNSFVVVKDVGSAETFNITINPNASENIDGAASYIIDSDFGSAVFVSDGTDWFIL